MCWCDFCCSCPHQTYLQIFHNKGISRRLLNIHSLPATLSPGKRWKEMSLLEEYRNSQGHSGTQQQNSAKQPLPMPAKPRSRWGFRWPWIESISNDTLKVNSRGTSECGLHFQGERRTHDVNTATIFPYSFQETSFSIILRVAYEWILRLLGVDCWNWQVQLPKPWGSYWGAPCSYWLSGASIDFCRFECVGLKQLLELLLRNWLWYSKLIWLRSHIKLFI